MRDEPSASGEKSRQERRRHRRAPEPNGRETKARTPRRKSARSYRPKAPRKHSARERISPRFSKVGITESGTINVRKVSGLDGAPKLQLRLTWACSKWS